MSQTEFLKKTPSRRRINSEETAKGYRLGATAEGDDYAVQVKDADEADVGKTVHTTLGAELASIIIETRAEFNKNGIPLAIPDFVKFIEEQKKPRLETKIPTTVKVKPKEQKK